ncbi:helix-turn-helix transcriptional regulator [Kineococcus sp. SYSU DK005]|uniref:helix-turn-helix transcriptional regulator n=1 Tax=Kineococcus sp. SYSU DK005 TaxID=3383126 RepID=UPI003D7E24C1
MTADELVGAAEAAELLGVSTVQVNRLSRREDFPQPVARLKAGTIWRRIDVERWANEHADRRPGRRPRP